MRRVKSSRNKSTEIKLIELFKICSIKGWRRNYRIFGKPDFVFLKLKLAIFVDGCFWHGHECRKTKPLQNSNYWLAKIDRNIIRDQEVTHYLIHKGWHVIRIWECELKDYNKITQKIDSLI